MLDGQDMAMVRGIAGSAIGGTIEKANADDDGKTVVAVGGKWVKTDTISDSIQGISVVDGALCYTFEEE